MKNVVILMLFILFGSLMGCSKKEESLEVLNKYYDNIKVNNFDMSYDYLSSSSQNIWTREKYNEWESISQQTSPIKEVKIEKSNEYTDKEINGVKYKSAVDYKVTEIDHDNKNDKDITSSYITDVVNENGQ